MDYNPEIITYEELIDVFFSSHDETLRPFDRRVMSTILYRTEAEGETAKRKLEEIRDRTPAEKGIYTQIKALDVFYLAEKEHQHRYLKMETSLYTELRQIFKTDEGMLHSVLVSKLNGLIYGYGTLEDARETLEKSGLSEASRQRIIEIIEARSEAYE